MRFDIYAISDVGCIRTNNEDMILVGDELLRDGAKKYELDLKNEEHPFLIAVADGMGGHRGGAFASEIVLTEMSKAIRELKPNMKVAELRLSLKAKIACVHAKLNYEGATNPDRAGMGSTFIGLLVYGRSIFYINIGDSRIYRFREGMLSQFSRDHSLMAMTNDPDAPKNVLVNSFGAGADIFFDFEDISGRIITGDSLILCSDGLTTELSDHEMESILSQSSDPELLVEAAKNRDGLDNISVVVVKYAKE